VLELGLKCLFAYFLGSLSGALLLGRLRGVDIREQGSGNAGGTNALRTQGVLFALGVVVIDVGKGVIAAGWLPQWVIPGVGVDPGVDRAWLAVACGVAAVFGHVWPMWYDFRGGKGAATLGGVLLPLAPWLLVPVLATWLVVVMLSGYVGLGTMVAALAAPVALLVSGRELSWPLLTFLVSMSLFVIWTHRSNIARMRAGTELHARRLWLFAPKQEPR
jgi:glycerol-3-phosphate acyltransferase PlsY